MLIYLFSVYLYVYVCMHTCMFVCMYIHVCSCRGSCMEVRGQSMISGCSSHLPPCWRQGLLFTTFLWGCRASLSSTLHPCLVAQVLGLQVCYHTWLCGRWEPPCRSLCSRCKYPTPRATPIPNITLSFKVWFYWFNGWLIGWLVGWLVCMYIHVCTHGHVSACHCSHY